MTWRPMRKRPCGRYTIKSIWMNCRRKDIGKSAAMESLFTGRTARFGWGNGRSKVPGDKAMKLQNDIEKVFL